MSGVQIIGLAVMLMVVAALAMAVWMHRRRAGGVLIAATVPTPPDSGGRS